MKFNIEPQDLQQMISKLAQYASGISQISSSMRSYASQLNSTWKDPQYMGFVDQVDGISKQLKSTEETIVRMEQQLKVLKQNLERAHQEFMRLR